MRMTQLHHRLKLFRIKSRWRLIEYVHRFRKSARLLVAPPPEKRELIFGISMHRTGTRSLANYLSSVGLRTLHWPWWFNSKLRSNSDASDEEIVALLDVLFYRYDAFTDVPFPGLYRALSQRFPKARFILFVRDSESWWRSIVRHWNLDEVGSRPLGIGEVIQYRLYEPFDKTVINIEDKAIQIAKCEQHTKAVIEHFADQPGRLLVVNLEDPHKNSLVSDFLGLEIRPFKHIKQITLSYC